MEVNIVFTKRSISLCNNLLIMNRVLTCVCCCIFFSVVSCTKTDPVDTNSTGSLHPFNVTIVERTSISAIIQWDSCINTINNEVPKYKVILKDSIVHNNLLQLVDSLKALNKDTVYRGKVVAYISTGDTLFSTFTLPTYQGNIYAATYSTTGSVGRLGYFNAYPTLNVYPQPTLWRINTQQTSGLTLSNDTLFSLMGNRLTATNAKTGSTLWQTDPSIYFNSTPTYYNGRLYACSNNLGLVAVNTVTGQAVWSYASPNPFIELNSTPVAEGGKVFVSTLNSGQNQLLAIDAVSGIKVWSTVIANSMCQRPLVRNGVLVILYGRSSAMTAYNSNTGSVLWSKAGAGSSSSIEKFNPIYSNGNVLANLAGTLSAFNLQTGALVWQFIQTGDIRDCITGNGIIYFCRDKAGSSGSNVYGLNASTGQVVWNTPFSDNFAYTNLVFAKDRVYCLTYGVYSGSSNNLISLSPLTGKIDDLFTSVINPIPKSNFENITAFTIVRDGVVCYPSSNGNYD